MKDILFCASSELKGVQLDVLLLRFADLLGSTIPTFSPSPLYAITWVPSKASLVAPSGTCPDERSLLSMGGRANVSVRREAEITAAAKNFIVGDDEKKEKYIDK